MALEILVPYHRYAKILMLLTASLLAYVATAAVVEVRWADALRRSLVPDFRIDASYFTIIVAVFGTTISPYLFFWQASEEVEEEKNDAIAKPLLRAPWQGPQQLRRIRTDTLAGMAVSNLIAWFIMLTTAATLHRAGTHDIESAAQAAATLEPIAGRFASWLFAAGIIGTGLLALPVLAGSVAYAVGEALHFPIGLERKPLEAPRFYGVIAVAMVLGVAMNALPVRPMKALLYTAVVNGVVAVPIMIMVMRLATRREVMGRFVAPPILAALGWAATAVMLVSTIVMFVTFGR
jgi:Mn2+/Fe2+ NRAMP family transporter